MEVEQTNSNPGMKSVILNDNTAGNASRKGKVDFSLVQAHNYIFLQKEKRRNSVLQRKSLRKPNVQELQKWPTLKRKVKRLK